jgi:K+-sensing histidine kinase KdpD
MTPRERARLSTARLAYSYGLGLFLPILTAVALIPQRVSHGRTTAIVLVVPVVVVAALGATGPALVAAVSAGTSFAVLLTPPYYRLAFTDADDRLATMVLIVVGFAVGLINHRLVGARTSDATRRSELDHLLRFASEVTAATPADQLAASACKHLQAVLRLQSCQWLPGAQPAGGPVLLPTGGIMGYIKDLNPDRAQLPSGLELPAMCGGVEIGCFALSPESGKVVSYEERLTAATIATMFAAAIDGP